MSPTFNAYFIRSRRFSRNGSTSKYRTTPYSSSIGVFFDRGELRRATDASAKAVTVHVINKRKSPIPVLVQAQVSFHLLPSLCSSEPASMMASVVYLTRAGLENSQTVPHAPPSPRALRSMFLGEEPLSSWGFYIRPHGMSKSSYFGTRVRVSPIAKMLPYHERTNMEHWQDKMNEPVKMTVQAV